MLVSTDPSITEEIGHRAIEASAKSGLPLVQLRQWLTEHPDGLRSGSSDCPSSALRLIRELREAGINVVEPKCLECGKPRKTLHNRVNGGRLCMTCYLDRGAEKCGRCNKVGRVSKREDDGSAVCHHCRLIDPSTWRPCGICGAISQPMTTAKGVNLGKCCYAPPILRCTVCGIRKGIQPYKTRRPVCAQCSELPRVPCKRCGLDAHVSIDGEVTVCARCTEHQPSPCSNCAEPTVARSGAGQPRCYDCYERESRSCGRCGRVRAIVRLARDGEPDLCGICWRGPVMTCEGCGRTGPCRGERKGKMLCINCRPRRAQVCSHCGGNKRPPTAHWHEGPICQPCYGRALAAKADCPKCGTHRRLRHYDGFDSPVCADCAGQPATHVCNRCGIEDWLYEKGVCPRCVAHSRLTDLLGDEGDREQSGMTPLFDALMMGNDPRAVIDWLLKSRKAVDVLRAMATGDLALNYKALDTLEGGISEGTARHLENLFTSTGTLDGRDPVLAATERWCAAFLSDIEHDEHGRCSRPIRAGNYCGH